MKKVLFVATVVKMHIMVFHIPYLKMFKKNGYEVHVCAKNDYENKEDCIIPHCDKYYDLPFERSPFKLNNIKAYNRLKELIDSNEYDIIHCHTPMGGVLTRLAALEAREGGTKVIYTAHGFHFFKGASLKNWLMYYPIERWLARYTDVLITINKEDYCRAKKLKAKRVFYVPGVGVDTQKFGGKAVDREAKRKELGIPDGAVALLSVGELNKRKNHKVVIKALAKLNNLKLIYIICGVGDLDAYLKGLAKDLGVEVRVRFLGFRKDISEIYVASDIFVFPSYQEGLPVALMEAMAAGLSVVCSNIRGNTDLIEDCKGGYLVAVEDVDGYANGVEKVLISNSSLMGQINIETIKHFDIGNVIDEMEKLYSEEATPNSYR